MSLCKISFLVADDDLTCEDQLIGLLVLHHLPIESKTLLENDGKTLDAIDFAKVSKPKTIHIGRVGPLIWARTLRVRGTSYWLGIDYSQRSTQPARDRPGVHHADDVSERDFFPDSFFLAPLDEA